MSTIFGNSNEYFVKGALTFSIMTMVLMTSFITVFAPDPDTVEGYESELSSLTSAYYDFTGSSNTNEQIWGLTGIYTPYGIDKDGNSSTKYGTSDDGWVYGARIESFTPSQYDGEATLNNGAEGYTVTYDKNKGLYYYTKHGTDLLDITNGTVSSPSDGTLYTTVSMDPKFKSDQFFTVGTKKEMENGTFFYSFSGYRYSFSSLSDYYYDKSTPITHTNTSLSLIWYQYTTDSGISGQLVLSGSDSGVSYITAAQIVQAFNSANSTSKFTMVFNGINMNLYIKLNPYAINHGYSVEDCYNRGYWSVLVTSPQVSTDDGSNGTLDGFDVNKVFDVVIGLLTFRGEDYGLTGTAGIIASTVFTVSLYTSLIAVGLSFWPVLIVAGLVAAIQTFSIADMWPW